ncbi:carboxypeptidase regulatory-like domain-containing protein [Tenacibaculum maritimum]|uniref:Lipoprotein n=2 Tax=Tenacibaculum maritimum TaxID=107401 RepID=A0A2H1E7H2_9FLAO|nr:carboxypeptidase regulatory-like domain-containing protein [Tenacibaculum maritimum]MCD9564361.1 carboxypeptidase regulatory-like domain-containing protein [Tenacibaculum maritimum]MCD9583364.1 carboxypeptidase regulatory-like domain-containing protein [Tenacibaculum maritimum]MCD9612178.1 carboxypeptidase regulatory-like domain-containing protein [Tenacibaculum maritimum]MDB0600869.1 carboxypeptidase regulatory-like domain-containing protein [Tenacibaculum maritimum]QCD61395.1 hypothetical
MRIIFLLVSILIISSCRTKPKFYRGYVFYDKKPLLNVIVRKDNLNESTQTDSTGFFKLPKEPNSIHSLIFEKTGFITDTIPSVWTQHGEKVNYTFLNKTIDTIFLRKITLPNKDSYK